MKKHSGLILFCVIVGLMGMVALAWGTDTVGVPSAISDFKKSNNVIFTYQNDGATAPQAYGTASKHTSGDRIFGTTDSSNVYYKTGVKGTALVTGSTPTAGDSTMSGWSTL